MTRASFLSVLFAASTAIAQPISMTHQGRVVGSDDRPASGALAMRFRLYATANGGTPAWESAQCTISLATGGLYAVVLGADGCDGSPTLSQEHMPLGAARWLEVTIDDVAMLPRMVMTAAPTAQVAANSLRLAGQTLTDLDARYARLGANKGVTLAGPLVAPSVSGDGSALTNLQPSKLAQQGAQAGQTLVWSGAEWQPSKLLPAQMAQGGAATGQVLEWDGTRWAPSTPAPHKLASDGAQPGQVLKWNGSTWAPAADIDTSNPGTVTQVSASGPLSVASGTTTPAISIAKASATQDGYLSATDWAAFDAKVSADDARLTNARTPSGAAGGDLTNSYPNPTIAKLQGKPVQASNPSDGQVLKWVAALGAWVPQADANSGGTVTSVTASAPLTATGTTDVAIGLPRATAGASGYLHNTDYARFDAATAFNAFNGIQDFPASGTWTVPAGIRKAYVRAWGGGGGGGGSYSTFFTTRCGGGGGGGAYAESVVTLTPGETLAIDVGGGGAGGASHTSENAGGAGGASAVRRGGSVLMSAAGGAGAPAATSATAVPGAGGAAASSVGALTLSGATGSGASGGRGGDGGSFGGNAGSASAGCASVAGTAGTAGRVVIYW